jgi:midasin (ATPase involved in ribosome maturation)
MNDQDVQQQESALSLATAIMANKNKRRANMPKKNQSQESVIATHQESVHYVIKDEKVEGLSGKIVEVDCPEFIKSFIPKDDGFNYIVRETDHSIERWGQLDPELGHGRPIANISLVGQAGSGKTMGAKHYALRHKLPFLLIPCDDSIVFRELLGYWQAKDGSTTWHEGIFTQMLRYPCVVLIDEVNALPSGRLFMLHELLENRRLFVKDAPKEQSVVALHPGVRIFMAMNPPGNVYTGTNRLNPALGSQRTICIETAPFTTMELSIETGNKTLDKYLEKFYGDVQEAINQQGLRVVISKRNMDRIVKILKYGATLGEAVSEGFVNCALLTAGVNERNALMDIANVVFGTDSMKQNLDKLYPNEAKGA